MIQLLPRGTGRGRIWEGYLPSLPQRSSAVPKGKLVFLVSFLLFLILALFTNSRIYMPFYGDSRFDPIHFPQSFHLLRRLGARGLCMGACPQMRFGRLARQSTKMLPLIRQRMRMSLRPSSWANWRPLAEEAGAHSEVDCGRKELQLSCP